MRRERRKRIVVLTGAGVSVESGFRTFRGADGLWEEHRLEDVCSVEGWLRNPLLVNEFYNGLRRKLAAAQPNRAHLLLAEMEQEADITVITQNVDDLHERAGSSDVVHLHGELLKVCSSRDKDDARFIRRLTPGETDVKPGQLAADGSPERPWIVFFGEAVPRMDEAVERVRRADVFVVAGTSLAVYPAASLVRFVRPDARVFIIDPDEVDAPLCPAPVEHLRLTASEGMARLRERLAAD